MHVGGGGGSRRLCGQDDGWFEECLRIDRAGNSDHGSGLLATVSGLLLDERGGVVGEGGEGSGRGETTTCGGGWRCEDIVTCG